MKRAQEMFHFPYFHGWAITVLRVVTGIVFFAHGWQKLFMGGLSGFEDLLVQNGVGAAYVVAPIVAWVELIGGLALIVGLFTRWAAIPLMIDMISAAAIVHLRNGFFLPNGVEFALVLLAATVSLFLAGSGELSLDGVWSRRRGAPRTVSREPVTA